MFLEYQKSSMTMCWNKNKKKQMSFFLKKFVNIQTIFRRNQKLFHDNCWNKSKRNEIMNKFENKERHLSTKRIKILNFEKSKKITSN